MNNQQRSPSQQIFMMVALGYLGWFMASQLGVFGPPPNQTGGRSDKPALTLKQAFASIDANDGQPLSKTQAQSAIKSLDAEIASNGRDDYSYWARLRAGLIEQYILGNSAAAIKRYDEIIQHAGTDAVTAQTTFQKGDLLWNQATARPGQSTQEAAKTLEQLIHKGRGAPQFLALEIFVPLSLFDGTSAAASGSGADNTSAAARAFRAVKLEEFMSGSLRSHPQGILRRVDSYYSTTVFHKIFDSIARLFGYHPAYSYGLAIVFFAIVTRLAMQPMTKMQYDSFKGMSVIAPEMKKIQDKYKNKPEQQAQMLKEIRVLQQDHGVRPMLGCTLALIQLPFFFVVVLPFIQNYEAHMELVGASFLWIENLAQPDMPLLIIYALSQFLAMRLTMTPPSDPQQAQMMAIMSIVFPLTVPFFMRYYSSAFPLYWMIYNVVNTVFQYRMMKATDPEKSVIKTLVGTGVVGITATGSDASGAASGAAADAVPARPLSKKSAKGARLAPNDGVRSGAQNGTRDGRPKSLPRPVPAGAAQGDGAMGEGAPPGGAPGEGALSEEDAFEPIGNEPIGDATGAPLRSGAATANRAAMARLPRPAEQRSSNRARSSQRARQRRRH